MAATIIGVFGAGDVGPETREWQAAYEVGRLLAQQKAVVLTGGLGGVMAAASEGAQSAGGTTLGILPGNRADGGPNPHVDIAVYTGMGEARNVINVKSCAAAIAIGGEYGTLSEIALALKSGCPLIMLDSWSFSREGREATECLRAGDPSEAVRLAVQEAGRR